MMMERVPHDVVEHILERVPVRSLLRFKCVSKQWKSTIESPRFQERQLKQRGGDPPDVLMVSHRSDYESLRTLVLGSSSAVKIPTPWDNKEENTTTKYIAANDSCDGLVCLYYPFHSGYVVNPATRWYHPLPLCQLQQLVISLGGESYLKLEHGPFTLGFGKDIISTTYKPVFLYNSSEIGLDNATTCEVFDFSANAWWYVTPSAPYRVAGSAGPVFVDGSLYWFTDCEETKILSFDLHTEAFQVISKAPFPSNSHDDDNPNGIVLCNLDNRLCVSHMNDSNQVIWSFNSGDKTWLKIFSIDVVRTSLFYGCPTSSCAFHPLALLNAEKKKKKKDLLFYDPVQSRYLLIHDPVTQRYIPTFRANFLGFVVCYFPSLISI